MIRADDAAGIIAATQLKAYIKKNKMKSLKVFLGETAPENLTGEIKKFKPSHLIIIDAVDFNRKPGFTCLLDSYKDMGVSFSTHKMPLYIMQDYLCASCSCQTMIIGIQPESCHFCQDLSKSVELSIKYLSEQITGALKSLGF